MEIERDISENRPNMAFFFFNKKTNSNFEKQKIALLDKPIYYIQ